MFRATRVAQTSPNIVLCTGRNGISAKVICDSINSKGNRLTTYELEYPRFIHSEFMTHRMLSKNAASSRAIPISKMIQNIQEHPAIPVHWGKNRKGMQATTETDNPINLEFDKEATVIGREKAWIMARDNAIQYANAFNDAGYHKQIVNRLLEPFKMIKVVCSGTEFDNFFWLRRHKDAQPDIKELADVMYEALKHSDPQVLDNGEYHLPYVTPEVYEKCKNHVDYIDHSGIGDMGDDTLKPEVNLALKVSASCCAQVSYRTTSTDIHRALRIYSQLVKSEPIHASPFEHQARPISVPDINDYYNKVPNKGITHTSKDGSYWSGNLQGFIQHRHEIPNNTCCK